MSLTFGLYLAALISLPFARPVLFEVGLIGVQITDVLLLLTYIALAFDLVRRRIDFRVDVLLLGALGYAAAMALSIAVSDAPVGPAWLKLLALTGYAVLPWLTVRVVATYRMLEGSVRAWLIGMLGAVAVGLLGLIAFAIDPDWLTARCGYGALPEGPYPRLCLPFRNWNILANYLAVSIPLVITTGAVLLPRLLRRVTLFASTLVATATLSTGIGAVALSAAVAVGGLLRRRAGGRRLARTVIVTGAVAASVFGVVTLGYVVPSGQGHVSLGDGDYDFFRGPRVYAWITSAVTISQRPLMGAGYGQNVARTFNGPWDLNEALDPRVPRYTEAHDVWLNVTAQAGLVGLIAFACLVYQVARRLSTRPLSVRGPLADLPLAGVAALVGGFLYHGIFEGVEEFRHMWALVGLAMATESLRGAAGTGELDPRSSSP